MHINILEDDIIQQQKLRRYLNELVQENNWSCQQINTYSKPEQLSQHLLSNGTHHIYFLDIEIKGSDKKGFQVAKEIRKHDPYAAIIFVTTHSEFLPLTFQYHISALDFIDKMQASSDFKQQLKECLTHLVEKRHQDKPLDLFHYNNSQCHFQIPFNDILFFETISGTRQIALVSKNKRIQFTGRLQDIEAMDDRLFRSHRSYLVNINKIEQIDKVNNEIILHNQLTCLISRRKIKSLRTLL
ncbi:response regulator transcription factor [Leuconostoc mesenteroides]|nr:response regulator transcription factor [Leuconostoc mesenteroides]